MSGNGHRYEVLCRQNGLLLAWHHVLGRVWYVSGNNLLYSIPLIVTQPQLGTICDTHFGCDLWTWADSTTSYPNECFLYKTYEFSGYVSGEVGCTSAWTLLTRRWNKSLKFSAQYRSHTSFPSVPDIVCIFFPSLRARFSMWGRSGGIGVRRWGKRAAAGYKSEVLISLDELKWG